MKDKKKILAHLFKQWRKKNKITLYRIAKDEGEGLSIMNLKRIESGESSTTDKLLQYIHFCHRHGYEVINDLLKRIDEKDITTLNQDNQ